MTSTDHKRSKRTVLLPVFLFLLLHAYGALFSQKQVIHFEHISIDDGLSQNTVCCILQDSKGFMWFGSLDGLNRYD
ncbi:MAG: hypothetical protein GY757_46350, partial [bacterium]|nr:hypothetical protein [bacterium]